MKKYITVAALLAAGTAFANAIAIETVSTPTFSWENVNDLTESKAFAYAGSATATPGENSVLFTADSVSTLMYGSVLYVAVADVTPTSNIEISFDLAGVGTTYTYGFISNETSTFMNPHTGLAVESPKTGAVPVASENFVASFKNADFDTFVKSSDGVSGTALFAIGFSSLVTGEFEMAQVSNITVSAVSNVPEPSAFGLLAGIGALALVASRRRRK